MDPRKKVWHEHHAKNVLKREKTHELRLLRRKLGLARIRSKGAMRMHLKVPATFSLFENYDETVAFINSISQKVFEDDLFVFLDFSECEYIGSETCVVLAAEIDRCKRKMPGSVLGSYPDNDKVYFMLNEIGFFSLLGIKSSKPEFDTSPEVSAIRLASGVDNAEQLMKGVKELFLENEDGEDPVEDDGEDAPYSRKVYRALTEAMGNAVEHAYPQDFKNENADTCIPIWWRAGFKLHKRNTVLMILYDQGAGIPNTLEIHWKEMLVELVTRLSRDASDDEKLEMAMEKGRSRTKVPGRGQGSYDMQSLIRESSDSALSILSYKGMYTYLSDGTWASDKLLTPLKGTLVVWKVCLDVEKRMAA